MLKALLTVGSLQGLTMLILLVRTKSLAIILGPELVGVLSVVDRLLAVFCQTASLSLPYAAIRFLPAVWSRDPTEYVDLLRRMRNLLLVMSLSATSVGLLAAIYRPSSLGGQLLPYRGVLVAGFLSLSVVCFAPFVQNSIAGRLQHNRSMGFALVHALVLTLSAVAGALWWGLAGLYLLYTVCGLALVVVVLRQLVRAPEAAEVGVPRLSVRLPAVIWRFSFSLLVLAFIAPYASLFAAYALLDHHGTEVVGWMQAAVGISLSVRAALGSAHAVYLTPQVNRLDTPEERMDWANRFQKTFCLLLGVAVPPLLLFPDLAVRLLYSDAFVPGAPYVQLFVAVEVLTLLAGTYGALVVALDRMAFHVLNNVFAQILLVTLAYLLIPDRGIAGVGIASAVSQISIMTGTLVFLRHQYGLLVPMRTAILALFVVCAFVGAGWIGAARPALAPITLAIKVGIYFAIVGGLILFFTREDWANLRSLLAQLRERALGTEV